MSDAAILQPIVNTSSVPAQQQQQVNNSQGQLLQVENAIYAQLNGATSFPVRYQPPKQMMTNSSGRMTLSIARARLEKDWEVKQINTQLGEDTEKTVCWLITPRKVLDQTVVGKKKDEDDIDFEDVIGPIFGRFKF